MDILSAGPGCHADWETSLAGTQTGTRFVSVCVGSTEWHFLAEHYSSQVASTVACNSCNIIYICICCNGNITLYWPAARCSDGRLNFSAENRIHVVNWTKHAAWPSHSTAKYVKVAEDVQLNVFLMTITASYYAHNSGVSVKSTASSQDTSLRQHHYKDLGKGQQLFLWFIGYKTRCSEVEKIKSKRYCKLSRCVEFSNCEEYSKTSTQLIFVCVLPSN